ncbi:MAG: 30S ribosome-binding factor RbfA [Ruminococcaceae bacterium]|nr:30S ribosome-binding factor RbfA [Oscillospiraceae bacterium]
MPKYRINRINDSVAQEISLILRDVKDPRVSDGMLTVTGADVSPDLKYAKIFYSSFTGDDKETQRGLRSAAGFIRSQLAHRLNLRVTPELTFVYDQSVSHGAHIAKLLHDIGASENSAPEAEENDGE